MVTTLLFAGITSLILCFFASLAEEFLNPQKRKAFFTSAPKRTRPRTRLKNKPS